MRVFEASKQFPIEERLALEGVVWVHRAGKGDETAAKAEDRAYATFAEIETEIRTTSKTVGGAVWDANLLSYTADPGVDADGRWTSIDFMLIAETQLVP